jgi:hypothetical protein
MRMFQARSERANRNTMKTPVGPAGGTLLDPYHTIPGLFKSDLPAFQAPFHIPDVRAYRERGRHDQCGSGRNGNGRKPEGREKLRLEAVGVGVE